MSHIANRGDGSTSAEVALLAALAALATSGAGEAIAKTGPASFANVPVSASSVSFADGEVPSGTVDSSNVTFTLAHTPTAGSLKVFKDGARLKITEDYTLATATITFISAPLTGSLLLADYRY